MCLRLLVGYARESIPFLFCLLCLSSPNLLVGHRHTHCPKARWREKDVGWGVGSPLPCPPRELDT